MISTQFLNDIISGDERAIETLVRTHQRGVFLLALTVLDDAAATRDAAAAQAEIATRETFIAALDRLPRYRESTSFTAWLYGITVRVSRRRARIWRVRRFFDRLLGRTKALEAFDGPARDATADDRIAQAVRGLPESVRLPVVLRYFHDYPINEIAAILRISEGAVHARLDRARDLIAGLGGDRPAPKDEESG